MCSRYLQPDKRIQKNAQIWEEGLKCLHCDSIPIHKILSHSGRVYGFVVNSRQWTYYIRKQRTINFCLIVFLTCSPQQESGNLFHFWYFTVIRGSSFFHLAPIIRCYHSDRNSPTYSFYEKCNSFSVIEFIFMENWKGARWPWKPDNIHSVAKSSTP